MFAGIRFIFIPNINANVLQCHTVAKDDRNPRPRNKKILIVPKVFQRRPSPGRVPFYQSIKRGQTADTLNCVTVNCRLQPETSAMILYCQSRAKIAEYTRSLSRPIRLIYFTEERVFPPSSS